ncbi:MAG: DUF3160 domain-containing protein [Verrucomicrobia bacterium]|nr:DUF3160 domain-containing protein [Verrucomicrobiota bacterium]
MNAFLRCLCWLFGLSSLLPAVPLVATRVEPFAPVPQRIEGPTEPAMPMEESPPVLAEAANLDRLLKEKLKVKLPPECRAFLAEYRFALLSLESTELARYCGSSDEMLFAFDSLAGSAVVDHSWHPRLITPDVFLHAFHRYFANSLEVIEQSQLRPRLEEFLTAAMRNAVQLRPQTDAATAARLEWVEAQLATAWIVLGCEKKTPKPKRPGAEDESPEEAAIRDAGEAESAANQAKSEAADAELEAEAAAEAAKDGETIYLTRKCDPRLLAQRLADVRKGFSKPVAEKVAAEVALILQAKGIEPSPLYACYDPAKPTDYSQFIVRSHYTKTEELRGWFRAMMFLGLRGQTLDAKNPLGLTDALVLAQVLARQPAKGPRPLDLWRPLMEITTFFAGPSDDLDYPAFRQWIADTMGTTDLKLSAATQPATLAKLTDSLDKLPLPKIVSGPHVALVSPDTDPPSFRIFGQRFSPDAWVFSALTRGSPVEAPAMPSGVFVTAAFGDSLSLAQSLKQVEPDHLPLFEKRMGECRAELAGRPDAAWFGSLAAAQLHAATRLCSPRGGNFPYFMRTRPFAAKNAESMLGSWTELKHDTVLYAKQAYAEMGEGGDWDRKPPPPPPVTRTLVQPDVTFWRALERLVVFADAGMAKHHLVPDAGEEFSQLGRFLKAIRLCRHIAEKEIAGQEITRMEYDELMGISLSYMDEPVGDSQQSTDERWQTALVTDVFSNAISGQALHEALGRPCVMLALVGDKPNTRIVTGLAYRHYEFARSMDARMTDEEWKKQVTDGTTKLPPRAGWAAPVFVPVPLEAKATE